MNLKKFKELTKDLPDDTVLIVPTRDHDYREPKIDVTTAMNYDKGHYAEDHGEGTTPEGKWGKRVNVVVFT